MVGKGGRGRKQNESNQVRGTGTEVTMVEVGPASVREGAARCPLPRCAVGWDAPAEKQGPWMLLGGRGGAPRQSWLGGSWWGEGWRMARELGGVPSCRPGGGEPAKGAMGV